MHVPSHAGALPDGTDPMPMPDTKRDAELLLLLLDAGLYPRIQVGEGGEDNADPGPVEEGLPA